MSDRESFERWWADRAQWYTSEMKATAWEAWQAAQAQAGDGEAVGRVYYTTGGFLDVDWFTSDIPDDALLYTRSQPAQLCPYIATSSEGTSWCRLAAKPQINQQLLEVLGSMGYDLVARNPFTQQRHGAGE